jgi:hypothetical protein
MVFVMQSVFQGLFDFGSHWWQYLIMYLIGGFLIYLAIKKGL